MCLLWESLRTRTQDQLVRQKAISYSTKNQFVLNKSVRKGFTWLASGCYSNKLNTFQLWFLYFYFYLVLRIFFGHLFCVYFAVDFTFFIFENLLFWGRWKLLQNTIISLVFDASSCRGWMLASKCQFWVVIGPAKNKQNRLALRD